MTTQAMPQHMVALARANEVRTANAELRSEVGSMRMEDAIRRVAGLIEDPPRSVQGVRVDFVLRWIPRWGTVRTHRLLARIECYGHRCVGPAYRTDRRALTERQRRLLAAELRAIADRSEAA